MKNNKIFSNNDNYQTLEPDYDKFQEPRNFQPLTQSSTHESPFLKENKSTQFNNNNNQSMNRYQLFQQRTLQQSQEQYQQNQQDNLKNSFNSIRLNKSSQQLQPKIIDEDKRSADDDLDIDFMVPVPLKQDTWNYDSPKNNDKVDSQAISYEPPLIAHMPRDFLENDIEAANIINQPEEFNSPKRQIKVELIEDNSNNKISNQFKFQSNINNKEKVKHSKLDNQPQNTYVNPQPFQQQQQFQKNQQIAQQLITPGNNNYLVTEEDRASIAISQTSSARKRPLIFDNSPIIKSVVVKSEKKLGQSQTSRNVIQKATSDNINIYYSQVNTEQNEGFYQDQLLSNAVSQDEIRNNVIPNKYLYNQNSQPTSYRAPNTNQEQIPINYFIKNSQVISPSELSKTEPPILIPFKSLKSNFLEQVFTLRNSKQAVFFNEVLQQMPTSQLKKVREARQVVTLILNQLQEVRTQSEQVQADLSHFKIQVQYYQEHVTTDELVQEKYWEQLQREGNAVQSGLLSLAQKVSKYAQPCQPNIFSQTEQIVMKEEFQKEEALLGKNEGGLYNSQQNNNIKGNNTSFYAINAQTFSEPMSLCLHYKKRVEEMEKVLLCLSECNVDCCAAVNVVQQSQGASLEILIKKMISGVVVMLEDEQENGKTLADNVSVVSKSSKLNNNNNLNSTANNNNNQIQQQQNKQSKQQQQQQGGHGLSNVGLIIQQSKRADFFCKECETGLKTLVQLFYNELVEAGKEASALHRESEEVLKSFGQASLDISRFIEVRSSQIQPIGEQVQVIKHEVSEIKYPILQNKAENQQKIRGGKQKLNGFRKQLEQIRQQIDEFHMQYKIQFYSKIQRQEKQNQLEKIEKIHDEIDGVLIIIENVEQVEQVEKRLAEIENKRKQILIRFSALHEMDDLHRQYTMQNPAEQELILKDFQELQSLSQQLVELKDGLGYHQFAESHLLLPGMLQQCGNAVDEQIQITEQTKQDVLKQYEEYLTTDNFSQPLQNAQQILQFIEQKMLQNQPMLEQPFVKLQNDVEIILKQLGQLKKSALVDQTFTQTCEKTEEILKKKQAEFYDWQRLKKLEDILDVNKAILAIGCCKIVIQMQNSQQQQQLSQQQQQLQESSNGSKEGRKSIQIRQNIFKPKFDIDELIKEYNLYLMQCSPKKGLAQDGNIILIQELRDCLVPVNQAFQQIQQCIYQQTFELNFEQIFYDMRNNVQNTLQQSQKINDKFQRQIIEVIDKVIDTNCFILKKYDLI